MNKLNAEWSEKEGEDDVLYWWVTKDGEDIASGRVTVDMDDEGIPDYHGALDPIAESYDAEVENDGSEA